MSTGKKCKDCGPGLKRPAPYPGPRCATHHRAARAARREAARALRLEKTYGLGPGQYDELYAAQGGVCYICERATGKARKLAVDHDHKTGFVRGLLCKPCNSMLAHVRDDVGTVVRMMNYLNHPPAHDVIGKVKPGV